jgi:WD40 repeat protein
MYVCLICIFFTAAGSVCFDEHASFSVLSIQPSPKGGKYLALATDMSRNIIMETGTDRIVRNLYGHKNDGFSNPKVSWSSNGSVSLSLNHHIPNCPTPLTLYPIVQTQYLYGNSQEENSLIVWDIASSSIVKKLEGHGGLVRDIYSSQNSDTVTTVSFDRTAKVWLRDM